MSKAELKCPYCGGDELIATDVGGGLPWHILCERCLQKGPKAPTFEIAWAAFRRRYVYPDKNGEPVYAGDEVTVTADCLPHPEIAEMTLGPILDIDGEVAFSSLYEHGAEIELVEKSHD